MMNVSLPLSASMARVDWRGEKTPETKRRIMQRTFGEQQYRRVSPRLMSVRTIGDEHLHNTLIGNVNQMNEYPRTPWSQRVRSKTRSMSARVGRRELGVSPGTQSLCLIPRCDVDLLIGLSVTPSELISGPSKVKYAEKKLESSLQRLDLSSNDSPNSSHSVQTVSAFELRRIEPPGEGVGDFHSKSAHIRSIGPSNSGEFARYRSANHSAVPYSDPAIARSMDKFIKANHLVYQEWSTERRRHGLEEGRLVSAKNKVIQGSRPIRKQWGTDYTGESASYKSFDTRRRSSSKHLRFAEAPTVISDDKLNISEDIREQIVHRPDVAEPMTPLSWSDQLNCPSAKIISRRMVNSGPSQSNPKEVQMVVVCTKPSDDYFERYMSKIRSSKSQIGNHKTEPNYKEYTKIDEDIERKVYDDQQELTETSNKHHDESDSSLSWYEARLISHPNQRVVNFLDINDEDVVKTVGSKKHIDSNADDDVASESSSYLQKRKEFEMSYTLSQSSMQSSSSKSSKGSQSQKINKIPTDDLLIVGSPLSSSRAINDDSSTSERNRNQSSSSLHQGKRISGVNFHSSSSSRKKYPSQRSSDDSSELVMIRQISSVRPTTAKSARIQRKESVSAKRVRIGESVGQSVGTTSPFPGEDARRSVIAKFAPTMYENEALWGVSQSMAQQDEQVFELKKDILEASPHKAQSRLSLKETTKFPPSSASWTPPPSPTTSESSNSKSNVIHCIPTAAVNYGT